ncbi:MAG: sulfatase-like hydrolase/transferase, partial [Proteobacteria bacterium]|nr:sulfatase-like hydrolase/transferase [Pseudomonadota bacterium]
MLNVLLLIVIGCTCNPESLPEVLKEEVPLRLRPNLVFVTYSGLRADYLKSGGYFLDTAPHMEALASEAIVFQRAVTPLAGTAPAAASLMTGTWPYEHGVLDRQTPHMGEQYMLAEFLSSYGYETAAFTDSNVLSDAGLDIGFQKTFQPESTKDSAVAVTDAAVAWLAAREDDQPFFLWVHYSDLRGNLDIEPPYDSLFVDDEGIAAWVRERDIGRIEGFKKAPPLVISDYNGSIRFLDDQFHRLVARLNLSQEWDETIVVLTSVSGRGLGQHGADTLGDLWWEQLHVPLMIKAPQQKATKVPHVVSLADVLPSVMYLVALPGKEELLEQVSGINVFEPGFSARPVFAQMSVKAQKAGSPEGYSLTTNDWHYLFL